MASCTIKSSSIKQEEPIDIDDSDAFSMVKSEPTESSPSPLYEIELIEDDTITLKEPKVEPVELLDSSEEDEKAKIESSVARNEESLKTVCQICGKITNNMAAHLESHIEKQTVSKDKNTSENTPKVVDSTKHSTPPRKRTRSSLTSTVTSTSNSERKKITASTRLSCEVCGITLSNTLVARIHARSHISSRPFKKEDLFEII